MKNIHLRAPTERQAQCLAVIASSLVVRGKPPTYVEIKQMVGVNGKKSVREYLAGLEKRGLVVRGGKGFGGSLRLTAEGMRLALNMEPCEACSGTGRQPIAKKAAA